MGGVTCAALGGYCEYSLQIHALAIKWAQRWDHPPRMKRTAHAATQLRKEFQATHSAADDRSGMARLPRNCTRVPVPYSHSGPANAGVQKARQREDERQQRARLNLLDSFALRGHGNNRGGDGRHTRSGKRRRPTGRYAMGRARATGGVGPGVAGGGQPHAPWQSPWQVQWNEGHWLRTWTSKPKIPAVPPPTRAKEQQENMVSSPQSLVRLVRADGVVEQATYPCHPIQ
jgi:hypothetical protein